MKVSLFIPCFVDQFYPQVGVSMAQVLERLGCEVDYPPGQTCCGQPPFNSGYWNEARAVAGHSLKTFAKSEIIVSASGSCGTMMKVFYPELFKDTEQEFEARKIAPKVHEFSEFLVNILGVRDVGAKFSGTATFHDGCHGLRELGIKREPRELLKHVRGLELVEMAEAETCCGFGGTFSVKFPSISTAMGEVKCDSIAETRAEYVISNDSSCLMQIQGLLDRRGQKARCLHLAEILAQT
ncbi:MAG: (Fe-S)-binding protein [Methylacidiphilales bacterium]|nr:(Fe-S)-binding protein [Candidatus Methylacidiphilales bacterium]